MRAPKPTCCRVDGCERTPLARGLCGMHYKRIYRHGSPHLVFKPGEATRYYEGEQEREERECPMLA